MKKLIVLSALALMAVGFTACAPFEGTVYEDGGPYYGDYGYWGGGYHHYHHHEHYHHGGGGGHGGHGGHGGGHH